MAELIKSVRKVVSVIVPRAFPARPVWTALVIHGCFGWTGTVTWALESSVAVTLARQAAAVSVVSGLRARARMVMLLVATLVHSMCILLDSSLVIA